VNLNEKDDSGRTPTHCAAYKGLVMMVLVFEIIRVCVADRSSV